MAEETTAPTSVNDPIKQFLGNTGVFINFGQGDENHPIEGIYVGCNIEDDPFNPGRQRMVYEIEIADETKSLVSGSKRLAQQMLDVNPEPGVFIKITRILGATQYDTTFKVETSPTPF